MSQLPYFESGLSTKNYGKDHSFFQIVNVTAGSFNSQPDVLITCGNPMNLLMFCTASSGNVYFSFNGNITHGIMTSLAPLNAMFFPNRGQNKIWFYGNGTIHVQAYSH
jgi:hypothetical protein